MSGLAVGTGVDAAALPLVHEPLPAAAVLSGAPTTALQELGVLAGVEIAVWEMTPGTARDIEVDEVFVVLSGRATIAFEHPPLPELTVGPGSVVRLAEGQRTVWAVTETLRKISIA